MPASSSSPSSLRPPDEHEAGGDPEAARCWGRVLALSLDSDQQMFVDQLRELYRRSQPLSDRAGFVPGGSMVFLGANVRIAGDGGGYYHQWRLTGGLDIGWREGIGRGSSHVSIERQLEVKITGAGAILVGVAEHPGVPGGAHTWFQSERHAATGNLLQSIGHGWSFVDHKRHGNQQVGAFGYSPYSEKRPEPNNPLVVQDAPPPNQCLAIVG